MKALLMAAFHPFLPSAFDPFLSFNGNQQPHCFRQTALSSLVPVD